MRILMIAPVRPWPLDRGDKIRVYYVAKELAKNNQVTLASISEQHDGSRDDMKFVDDIVHEHHSVEVSALPRALVAAKSLWSLSPYRNVKFHNDDFQDRIRYLLEIYSYDAIWIHFLNMCSHLSSEHLESNRIVLDQHNADERMWERYSDQGGPTQRVFAMQNLWKLRRFQRKILPHVDVLLSVSQDEADFMRLRAPTSCNVWVMPNGVDTEYFKPGFSDLDGSKQPKILFCGSMDVTMNADAVIQFARRILPIVKERVPGAEFWIVGRHPIRKVQELAKIESITVTGSVEDVRPYYREASVVVAPFRYGAGTKLKVLEAMAMGVPVVATSIGCQGIQAEPGRHLHVHDGDDTFIERIIELLQDSSARAELGAAGRAFVRAHYSWGRIVEETVAKLQGLIDLGKDATKR